MPVPDEFRYAWKISEIPVWKAYERLERIFKSYEQGIGIVHTNNNIPYIDYLLRSQGFLEFETIIIRKSVKVTPTEKALEIYQKSLQESENSH